MPTSGVQIWLELRFDGTCVAPLRVRLLARLDGVLEDVEIAELRGGDMCVVGLDNGVFVGGVLAAGVVVIFVAGWWWWLWWWFWKELWGGGGGSAGGGGGSITSIEPLLLPLSLSSSEEESLWPGRKSGFSDELGGGGGGGGGFCWDRSCYFYGLSEFFGRGGCGSWAGPRGGFILFALWRHCDGW